MAIAATPLTGRGIDSAVETAEHASRLLGVAPPLWLVHDLLAILNDPPSGVLPHTWATVEHLPSWGAYRELVDETVEHPAAVEVRSARLSPPALGVLVADCVARTLALPGHAALVPADAVAEARVLLGDREGAELLVARADLESEIHILDRLVASTAGWRAAWADTDADALASCGEMLWSSYLLDPTRLLDIYRDHLRRPLLQRLAHPRPGSSPSYDPAAGTSGYAGVSRRGGEMSVVPWQLGLPKSLVAKGLADRELLYYASWRAQEPTRRRALVVLDATARMLGRRSLRAVEAAASLVTELVSQRAECHIGVLRAGGLELAGPVQALPGDLVVLMGEPAPVWFDATRTASELWRALAGMQELGVGLECHLVVGDTRPLAATAVTSIAAMCDLSVTVVSPEVPALGWPKGVAVEAVA